MTAVKNPAARWHRSSDCARRDEFPAGVKSWGLRCEVAPIVELASRLAAHLRAGDPLANAGEARARAILLRRCFSARGEGVGCDRALAESLPRCAQSGNSRQGAGRRLVVLLGDAAAAAGAARRHVRGLCVIAARSTISPTATIRRWPNRPASLCGVPRWRRSSPASAKTPLGKILEELVADLPSAPDRFPVDDRRHADGCGAGHSRAKPGRSRSLLRSTSPAPSGAYRCAFSATTARRGSCRAPSWPRLAAHQYSARSGRGRRTRPAVSTEGIAGEARYSRTRSR